jgi:hypothetical protein
MPFKASPLRSVAALDLTAVAAGSVSLSTSTVEHANGFASGVYAVLPDKHDYDYLRFSFGLPTMGNADNVCTLGVWMRQSDATFRLIGQTALADGAFPEVDVPNYDGRYWIAPLVLTGTTPAVTVKVSVQGLYSIPTVFAQA